MALLTSYPRLAIVPRALRRAGFLPLALLIATVTVESAAASDASSTSAATVDREYQIKAVFLLNFARFVAWPREAFASDTAPLQLGVLGHDPFGTYLDDAVRGETVNHRPITVRRFERLEDVTNCHVLFIGRSETANLDRILERLNGRKILTVGDSDNFAELGGIIGFVKQNEKVRLQINLDAAKSSELTISAKLLRPSEIVGSWKKRQLRLRHHSRQNEAAGGALEPVTDYAVVRRDATSLKRPSS
jgi:hypothetical protein